MSEQQKRRMTAEDLYQFKTINTPRISPDGKAVVYGLQWVEQESEKKYSNLWIAFTDGRPAKQFTFGKHADSSPEWSPDGKSIAFLSNRENAELPPQLYVIPFGGGEARKVTDLKGSIRGFSWSPDGSKFLCTFAKSDPEVLERMGDEKKKKLGVVSRHYTRTRFKYDGIGYLPKEMPHLWVVDAESGEAVQLTDHEVYTENGAVWAPDGKTIAFTSNRSEQPDFHPYKVSLYTIPAAGGEMREIPTEVGGKGSLSFSPDGKTLAYIGAVHGKETWHNDEVWVVPVDGSQMPRNLTADYDETVAAYTLNDTSAAELMAPIWSKDGQTLYFQTDRHGSTRLMGIPAAGGEMFEVIGAGGVVSSQTLSEDNDALAYMYGKIDRLMEVYARDMKTGETKQITFHNDELIDELDLGRTEEVWFKGSNGNDLQGWILTPPGFDPEKQYPSILEIHGGPQAQYGYHFMHEFYYLAAQGYVVYYTNPRGGTGYGEEHTRAIYSDWGNVDYKDLMCWTDYVEKLPYIDQRRMGVTGGSYGGYMTVWIIGHTHRFKAAVTQRCVSNLLSMWGSSDMNWATEMLVGLEGASFENLEEYWRQSPIAYIGNAKTPTLVIHSEMDLRCPIEQGEQVFVALKKLGIDSEMVRFPDEPHGLSRNGRTDRRVVRLNHISGWFNRYL
ncbi:MAG: S9 family peptidase [Anaerolineaceae bacterium]|nr:S9 family peptidase [Anaerolineaceae bacterium]